MSRSAESAARKPRRRPGLAARAVRHPGFLVGAILTGAILSAALLAIIWTPHPVAEMNVAARLQPPSADHWLGTDHLGRDLLSLLMAGAGNSLAVGAVAVSLGLGLGAPLGILAAMRPGPIGGLVMRSSDLAFAFPALLTAIMLSAINGPGMSNAIVAIGIFNIPVFARLARGLAISVARLDYIAAARACGLPTWRIALNHVLPNVAGALVVQATIQFAMAILAEAGLSYLGLGTQPPQPSWGRMLHEAQTMLYFAPRLAILPGLSIALAVLGLNLLGDGLRDLLDPRLRAERLGGGASPGRGRG